MGISAQYQPERHRLLQACKRQPVLQRNQFGFMCGGPIVKNQAFFFADWEAFRQRERFVMTANLPTAAQRQGVFPTQVTNPLTGATYPANTPLLAGAVTPFARKVLDELPLPNGSTATEYRNLRADRNNNDKMDLKLDHQIGSRMTAFIRGSHRKSNYLQAATIPGPSGGDGNGFIRVLNQQIAGAWTYTVTPSSLLEARFAASKTRAGKEPPYIGGASMNAL
jgi:hypothetical protein